MAVYKRLRRFDRTGRSVPGDLMLADRGIKATDQIDPLAGGSDSFAEVDLKWPARSLR